MAGIVIVPLIAIGTFCTAFFGPYVPAASLFTMPAILTFSGFINANIDWFNTYFMFLGLKSLQWWNILLSVLSFLGILPSFILVPIGFVGIILTFLLTPVWIGLEILAVLSFIIYFYIDPTAKLYNSIMTPIMCFFKLTTSC